MPVSFNGSYSQNFDTLANTGTNVTWTNDTTLPGWFLFSQPGAGTALTTYFTDNGSENTGNFYSYGTIGSTERALGGVGSGGAYFGNPAGGEIAGWIAFAATNNTGTTLTALSISFNGEQWRAANTTPQNMVLQYGFGSSFIAVSWTAPGGNFDWTSPVNNNSVTVDGNLAGRVSGRGGTINTSWANGDTLWIRWLEVNDAGFDHGLAIDDFSLTVPTVSLTPASLTQNEGNSGTTDYTFTVTLSRAITQNVTVNYSTDDGTATLANNDYIDNDNSIIFTAGGSLTQTITVQAKGDAIVESNETFTVWLNSATNAQIDTTANQVTGTITNDDTAGITITQSGGSTNITEGGATDTYEIVLTSQPTADVTIAINNGTQTGTSPTALTFTSANWNTPQTVTVTAINDNVASGNNSGTISHTATSSDANYNGITINSVTANITDNDNAGITITQSGGSTNITEGGATDTYEIVLTSQPTADVTIAINNGTQTGTSPTALTFTSANWNTPQTVTVTAINDNVASGNNSGTISHTATSSDANYNGITINSVTANITDNDNAALVISSINGNTSENGGIANFTVVLTSQPTADVTVNLASSNSQDGTATASITFNATNWNQAQTVTVTGVDDNIDDGDITYNIQTSVVSSDPIYAGIAPNNVTVTNIDNDTAGFTITPTSLSTNETGTPANFTVKLDTQPTADVTINLSSSNTAEGTIDRSSLTFTAGNWNTAQTVTITGIDDSIADGDKAYQIITAAAISTDSNYNNLNPVDINVTNTDNETAGFTITPTTLTTGENGTTATFTVKLNTQPTADVTLGLSSSNTTEGRIDKSSLTFTDSNWNTAQTVTITGIDDNIIDGERAYQIITADASSNDSNYNNLNPVDINVTNTDKDSVNVSITPAALAQPEGNNDANAYTFTVNLSNPSTVPVTVAYTNDNGSAIAFSDYIDNDGTIAFNPGETSQSITVNVLGDIILETDETFTVNLTSATNATINSIAKQSTGIITNDDIEEDCFCKQIVYPNLDKLTGEAVLPNTVSSRIDSTANNNILIGNDISEAINGLDGDDFLFGSAGNDNLYGNAGNDTAFGGSDRDFILGNQGNDFLNGNTGNDVLNGNQGNDNARGGQGNDFVRGGRDDDLIWGDKGDDTLAGDKGNDTVFGGNGEPFGADVQGRDLLFGGSGDDLLNGNQGNDTLFGEDGNDTVRGGKEDDIVVGNAGNDLLFGDLGNDSLCGEAGNDTIFGGIGSEIPVGANGEKDCICGGEGNDLLFGNEGQDKLNGDEGNDTLMGGKDNDTLTGGADNDRLIGDLGNDLLAGGTDSDRFVLLPGKDTDTIGDFEDGIDLLEIGGNLSFAQLSIIQGSNATLINVTQTGELLAILNGVQANLITQQDFTLLSSA